MSKITFRADEDLIARIEARDASKSEVMREALHAYFDTADDTGTDSFDELLADRIDRRIDERLDTGAAEVDLTITVEDDRIAHERRPDAADRSASRPEPDRCDQCGEAVDAEHVYCPNCGEKTVNTRCECGAELRSDWAFCPDCGRRTPAADVLDR